MKPITDDMTGVYTAATCFKYVRKSFLSTADALSIVIFDLDRFKLYNGFMVH
jgi:GGDEF domain-containing protein